MQGYDRMMRWMPFTNFQYNEETFDETEIEEEPTLENFKFVDRNKLKE